MRDFNEALKLAFRGYKIWWKKLPMYFVSTGLWCMVSSLAPYVGIYITAQLINEIAGARDADRLRFYVIAALVSAMVLGILIMVFDKWRGVFDFRIRQYTQQGILAEKLLSMDFIDVDSSKCKEKIDTIIENSLWNMQWGFISLINTYRIVLQSLFRIGGAVLLTISLFTLRIPEDAGAITILNHPLFILAAIVVLLTATTIAPKLYTKGNSYLYRASQSMNLANRMGTTLIRLCYAREKAVDVRMYNQENIPHHYVCERNSAYGKNGMLAKLQRGVIGLHVAAANAVGHVFTGLIYVFVCLKAWGGAFGVGSITQYVGAVSSLSEGVGQFIIAIGLTKNNAPYLKDIYEFLDTPNAMYQGSLTTEKRSDNKYEITFKNVSFKYPGSDEYALKNVSIKFDIGERLAIVGQNGSGKTTFIKLLCRLYDPVEGEIILGGFDIKKYDYREYMDIFTVMFQDFQLLSVPLGQNVAADKNYDSEKALDCLNRAGFDMNIMPKGLETCLYKDFEDDGVDVSGGEAQKIALARAVYRKAPFVILDEPTAALDPVAEFEIYSKMNEIVGSKTAVFISHRLSSCRFCKDIAVFHEGELIERGSHEELLAKTGGKYNELWNAQAGYYNEAI